VLVVLFLLVTINLIHYCLLCSRVSVLLMVAEQTNPV